MARQETTVEISNPADGRSLGPNGLVPVRFEATVDDPTLPLIYLEVRVIRGRPVLCDLRVQSRIPNVSITTEALRRVRPPALLRLALRAAALPTIDHGGGVYGVEGEDPSVGWGGPQPGPGRGRPMDDETLRRVAAIYRAAVVAGEPPTRAVKEQMFTSRTSAGRWVTQARQAGHLGPAIKRQSGERTQR